MDYEREIKRINKSLAEMQDSIIQLQKNNQPVINKVDDTAIRVDQMSPYTETKKAYYNEKEKTFYNVPPGYVTVLFDNYNGNYSVNRVSDRVTVSFDALTESTNIKILIN